MLTFTNYTPLKNHPEVFLCSPSNLLFKAEPVSLKFPTHKNIVFLSGIFLGQTTPKFIRNEISIALQ